jgi:hypothetical protein
MALHAISRRQRRQPVDLSAGGDVAAEARGDAGQPQPADNFFEPPWEEPEAGETTGQDGTDVAASGGHKLDAPSADGRPSPAGPEPSGTVVLAVGRAYFHDGTVGEGRYEADVPPTLLASIKAIHVLAQAVFAQVGALEGSEDAGAEITVARHGWLLRLGPEPGQAQLLRPGQGSPASPAPRDRRTHQWLRGIAALRQSDHAQALAAFEAEAAEAVAGGSPQRAAVAYRAAAASARSVGRADQCNRLLRLTGKAYLEIAEAGTTIPQGVFSAYREAARAFLDAGNLPLAQQCLNKALTVGEALGLVERT